MSPGFSEGTLLLPRNELLRQTYLDNNVFFLAEHPFCDSSVTVTSRRFSAGNSGVYFAARDLFISELSGRFDLDMELAVRPDGSKVARVTVALGGAAGDEEMAAE